jgi:hypothetical protein
MRSFWSKLHGRQNRTAAWQAVPALNETLTVDLTTHRFGAVAVGEPIDRLSFLGPADNCHEQTEIYDYKKRGFYLVEDEGRLEAVVFILRPERGVVTFVGRWVCDGRSRTITSQTRPQDIRWDLGEPSRTETEPGGELVWVYEFPGVEWEFAWSPEQALESVEMRLPGAG